jgi:hypothetical protein
MAGAQTNGMKWMMWALFEVCPKSKGEVCADDGGENGIGLHL